MHAAGEVPGRAASTGTQKVVGTTIAELGAGNRPLDMVVYKKDGKEFLLMSNTSRGVMKIPTAGFGTAPPITARVGGTAGVAFETIATMTGVEQMDLLDAQRSIVIARDSTGRSTCRPSRCPSGVLVRCSLRVVGAAGAVLRSVPRACGRPPLLGDLHRRCSGPHRRRSPRPALAPISQRSQRASLTREQWQQIFTRQRCRSRRAASPATIRSTATVRFTPMYGFDKGRPFDVYVRRLPDSRGRSRRQLAPAAAEERRFGGRPAAGADHGRRTGVSERRRGHRNMLRFYIEFSAPMGRGSALDTSAWSMTRGRKWWSRFCRSTPSFWTPDRTRFTLFFDPGRVKRGIKPNRDLGRALIPGKRYALMIGEAWLDGRGEKLRSGHRHEFSVRPPSSSRWMPPHGSWRFREPAPSIL